MHKLAAGIAIALAASTASATRIELSPVAAPTLSEIGLGALVVILAGVAGWVIRKRK